MFRAIPLGAAERRQRRRFGSRRRDLLAENSKDSWQVRRIFSCTRAGQAFIFLFIQLAPALAIDNADAFADGVENQAGLLGNQRPFQRKKIGRVGKDGPEMIVTKSLNGLINGGNLHDLAGGSKSLHRGGIARLCLAGEDQDFILLTIQAVGLFQKPHNYLSSMLSRLPSARQLEAQPTSSLYFFATFRLAISV